MYASVFITSNTSISISFIGYFDFIVMFVTTIFLTSAAPQNYHHTPSGERSGGSGGGHNLDNIFKFGFIIYRSSS
jgi:hypothetical protein